MHLAQILTGHWFLNSFLAKSANLKLLCAIARAMLKRLSMSSSRAAPTIGYVPHLNPLQPFLVSSGHRMKLVSQVKKVFGTKRASS